MPTPGLSLLRLASRGICALHTAPAAGCGSQAGVVEWEAVSVCSLFPPSRTAVSADSGVGGCRWWDCRFGLCSTGESRSFLFGVADAVSTTATTPSRTSRAARPWHWREADGRQTVARRHKPQRRAGLQEDLLHAAVHTADDKGYAVCLVSPRALSSAPVGCPPDEEEG